jgi:hypothetical protein
MMLAASLGILIEAESATSTFHVTSNQCRPSMAGALRDFLAIQHLYRYHNARRYHEPFLNRTLAKGCLRMTFPMISCPTPGFCAYFS